MHRLSTTMRQALIGLAVFSLFAVAVGVAGAQRPTPSTGPEGRPPQASERGALHGELLSKVAAKLGITEAQLKDAMQSAMEELRPQMQERMQQFRERMKEHGDGPMGMREDGSRRMWRGHGPMGGRDGGPMGMQPGGPGGPAIGQTAAEILGMDLQAMRDELRDGKTLAELGQARGIDADTLANRIATKIEQTHGEQMRSAIRQSLDRQPPTPPFGRGGDRQQ